jgi:hypothetical protein
MRLEVWTSVLPTRTVDLETRKRIKWQGSPIKIVDVSAVVVSSAITNTIHQFHTAPGALWWTR